MKDLTEVAAGEKIECLLCGDTLVRTNDKLEDPGAFRESATGLLHECWEQLPPDANHLRLD